MLLELMLQDEYREGKAEGMACAIVKVLEASMLVPVDLQKTIMNEKNIDTLDEWLKLAAKATSIEQFIQEM